MTVSDLIDYLNQFESSTPVVLTDGDFAGEGNYVSLDTVPGLAS